MSCTKSFRSFMMHGSQAGTVAWSCRHVNVKARPGERSRCEKVPISSNNNLAEKALFFTVLVWTRTRPPLHQLAMHKTPLWHCILTITAHWQPRITKLYLYCYYLRASRLPLWLNKWTHRTTYLSAFMSGSNWIWLKGSDSITFVCDTACPLSFSSF